MRTLYPAIKPYATRYLQVDNIHGIYVEECGTQDGIPVLFVHGGPGAGCTDRDPDFAHFNHLPPSEALISLSFFEKPFCSA